MRTKKEVNALKFGWVSLPCSTLLIAANKVQKESKAFFLLFCPSLTSSMGQCKTTKRNFLDYSATSNACHCDSCHHDSVEQGHCTVVSIELLSFHLQNYKLAQIHR